MDFLRQLLQKEYVKKILVLSFVALAFYLMKSLINVILLTFLVTYLIYSLHEFLYKIIGRYLHINDVAMTIILYLLLIGIFVLSIWKYAPAIINEFIAIVDELSDFKIDYNNSGIGKFIGPVVQQIDLKSYVKDGASIIIKYTTLIGRWSFDIFIALMLSMLFMFERKSINRFFKKFETSKVNQLYFYLREFGKTFLNSFGKVIQTQVIIAIVNTGLSVVALTIMGFPQVLGLGLMIFNLSLIPVAGVIISLIPLCIIGYQIGGIIKVVYVLIMIALLHTLESYILNPKFMSAKTKLPVFFTFIILIASQHFMGIWGLLIGIPLFMFMLDLLGVKISDDMPKEPEKHQ